MKHPKNNRLFLIFILTLSALGLLAGAAIAECDCIAANGTKYPDDTVGTVPCYQCPDTGTCVQIGTLVCTGKSASAQPTEKAAEKTTSQSSNQTAAKEQATAVPTSIPTPVPTAVPTSQAEQQTEEEAAAAEPEATESAAEPQPEAAAAEPEVTESAAEPQPETAAAEPEVTESAAEPQPEAAAAEPEVTESAAEPQSEEATVAPEVTETAGESQEEDPTEEPEATETAGESQEEDPAEEPEATETAGESQDEDPAEEPEATETAGESQDEDPAEEPEATETAGESQEEDPAEEPETTETAGESQEEDPAEEPETTETAGESQEEDPVKETETAETAAPTAVPTATPEPKAEAVQLGNAIEGKLKTLTAAAPASNAVLNTVPVTFTWTYTVTEPSGGSYDVDFLLSLTIVDSSNGQTTNSSTTISSTQCSSGTCTYTSGSELNGLTQGVVTWYVTGTYTDGTTEKSVSTDIMQFSIQQNVPPTSTPTPTPTPQPLPDAPVLECPSGRYLTRGLGFYWAPAKNADSYEVRWNNDRGQNGTVKLSANDSTCLANRCVAYTILPGEGNYTWNVSAVNTSGETTSSNLTFEIASNISTPNPYKPGGTIVNRTYPSFQWENVEDGAVEYRIQIVRKYDGRVWLDNWYSVDNMYVGNGVCEVQTDIFLPAGTYCWRVQARNNEFHSGWSSWLEFYVECDYCTASGAYYGTYTNLTPSPVYPSATTITTLNPDFQWRPMTGVSYYQFKLFNAKGTQLLAEQVSSTFCTTEVCTYDPQYQLPENGTYAWTIEAYGPNGGLWGTANGSFTVEAVIELSDISFVSPEQNGYLDVELPLVIWTDPGENATIFHVSIQDNTGTDLFEADLNREAAWCDGQTCSIQFGTIPDGEDYKIAITPYSDQYVKGNTAELVFSKGPKPLEFISPKEGAVVSARPLFRWSLDALDAFLPETVDAALLMDFSYVITLKNAQDQLTVISVPACGEEGVTCEDKEEFFVPSEAIPAGEYTVQLGIKDVKTNSPEIHITVQ